MDKKEEISKKVEEIKAEVVEYKSEIGLPTGGMIRLIDTIDEIVEEWNAYLELVEKLLDKNDYSMIKDKKTGEIKPYKRKSGWRKLAKAFNLSDRILREEIVRDGDNNIIRANYVVECIASNNRRTVGTGAMHRSERSFAHIEHDLPAMAHVRAKNRAISDMIGCGESSAEEMEGIDFEQKSRPATVKDTTPKQQPVQQSKRIEQVYDSVDEYIDDDNVRRQIEKLDKLYLMGDNKEIIDNSTRLYGKRDYKDLTIDQRAELLRKFH